MITERDKFDSAAYLPVMGPALHSSTFHISSLLAPLHTTLLFAK
jgi:hypothetical protein